MKQRKACAFGAFLAAVCCCGTAWADAIDVPPDDCPTYAEPQSCHGGPFCEPRLCEDESQCTDGEQCEPMDLCIVEIDCAGGWGGGPSPRDTIAGACGTSCDGSCQTIDVCVGQSEVTRWGCGCTSPGPRGFAAIGPHCAALCLFALLLWRVRRRR